MCKIFIVLPGVIICAVLILIGLIVTFLSDSLGDFFFRLAFSSIEFFNGLNHFIFDNKGKSKNKKYKGQQG